ncbi:MAG: metallophosphoesterase family protein [Clostridia bacterium]|nr:metallophosphoesterase family protein [Clostridia bacterium]
MSQTIAVISDTHGLLRPEVVERIKSCDVILHAGDFADPKTHETLLALGPPLIAVRGNNDSWSRTLPHWLETEVAGLKLVMAHTRDYLPPAFTTADLVVFGHTHRWFSQRQGDTLWLNPGSCGYPRFGLPLTYAILTVEEGTVRVEQVPIKP